MRLEYPGHFGLNQPEPQSVGLVVQKPGRGDKNVGLVVRDLNIRVIFGLN